MNLLEHEAKALLSLNGIKVPKGKLVVDEGSLAAALEIVKFPSIMKAQVPTGGRGKAGAIVKVEREEDAGSAFRQVLGKTVKGHEALSVLMEDFVPHEKEFYLAIVIDRAAGRPVLMYAAEGGVEVESKSAQICRSHLDPFIGPDDELAQDLANGLGLYGTMAKRLTVLVSKMWSIFVGYDCELVEINPLVLVKDELVCLDAKVVINDDSLFRHEDLGLDRDRGRSDFEISCRRKGFTGVELEGEVGVIANGAGLTMAVLDELDRIGLEGAAFIDLGGTDDPTKIAEAVSLMLDDDMLAGVNGLLICVFGGITRCDVVASGIIGSLGSRSPKVPLMVRLRGVNEILGREMLREVGIDAYTDLEEACLAMRAVIREGHR